MHKLIEYICDELEELERKAEKDGKLSMQEVQYMDTLAHAKKNLLKSEMMEDDGYSMSDGYVYARGRRGNVRRDSMGRYSSDMRYPRDGYSRDGYSMDGDFHKELEELIHNAPNDHVRQKLKGIMAEM